MELTYHEAHFLLLMDRALQSGRLNRESPTFTSRALALAIGGLDGVLNRPNEREIGALLDQMGVFLIVRYSRRKTADLEAALPAWREAAQEELDRVREIEIPALAPHLNSIR